MESEKRTLGIGFATGRKSFRKVLKAYVYSWKQALKRNEDLRRIGLTLFVAYDLDYSHTQSTDFTNLPQDIVDVFENIVFLGTKHAQRSVLHLIDDGTITQRDAKMLFGTGYGGKRNAILYAALENQVDYLMYLDDDEYPVAVTKSRDVCLWGGQHVLPGHLRHIEHADITNGHHCGYISPIPQIAFNEVLTEDTFRLFIEAISNDIISWDSIRRKMKSGGVTYANTSILTSDEATDVREENHCKFISGANLCINLTKPERTFPFYNPPGARGEDTFLSTLLSERTVKRIPYYTFHDGFSAYNHVLDGVLPVELAPITTADARTVTRFYKACLGWVRYKPLLTYLTRRDSYESRIERMKDALQESIPAVCRYFGRPEFEELLPQLERYHRNVRRHERQFTEVQMVWQKMLQHPRYSARR